MIRHVLPQKKRLTAYAIALLVSAFYVTIPHGSSIAQENKEYTVDTIVNIALKNYDLLKVKQSEIFQNTEMALHQKRWENPEAGVTVGQKRSDGDSGLIYSVTLSQKIPLSGKKELASDISKLDKLGAEIAMEDLTLALRYDVVRLAYDHARDLIKTGHIKERLRRLKLINAYMQGHILVAPQKIVERNIIQARIIRMEIEFLDIRKSLRLSFEKLNGYLKLEDEGPLNLRVRWFSGAPQISINELLETAKDHNFEVRAQMAVAQKAKRELSIAKREIVPDIDVNLFYQDERAGTHDRAFGGGISMPIPILSQNRHAVKKESMNITAQLMLLDHIKNKIARNIKESYAEYEHAKQMLLLYPMSELIVMERKMEYADSEFRKGRISLSTYLEMDNALHEAIESVFDSQLAMVKAYSNLLYQAAITRSIEGDLQ